MSDFQIDDAEINRRNWIALGIVGLGTLAFTILCSPAFGVYDFGTPQKQIAASIR
jgi:hypothetical protein